MTLQDDRLSEVSLTRSALGSCQGYNPEFYAKAMSDLRLKATTKAMNELKEKLKTETLALPSPEVHPPDHEPVAPPHIKGRPTLNQIKYRVAWVCGVSIEEIESIRRNKNIVNARHMYAYLARKYTSHSFPQIGKTLGGRDHSTIIHAATAWPKRKTKLRAGK